MDTYHSNIFKEVKNIYNKQTYFQKYGGDLWFAIILITVFTTINGVFASKGKINTLKSNWSKNRCNPGVMPFAGVINSDKGTSAMEYTENNFTYCIQNLISSIAEIFLAPIFFALSVVEATLSELSTAFGGLLDMFNKLREFLEMLLHALMQIVMNISVVFTSFVNAIYFLYLRLLSISDVLKNIMKGGVATAISTVSFIVRVIIIFILIIMAVALALIIAGYVFPPFTLPIALVGAILLALAILVLVIILEINTNIAQPTMAIATPGS